MGGRVCAPAASIFQFHAPDCGAWWFGRRKCSREMIATENWDAGRIANEAQCRSPICCCVRSKRRRTYGSSAGARYERSQYAVQPLLQGGLRNCLSRSTRCGRVGGGCPGIVSVSLSESEAVRPVKRERKDLDCSDCL